MEGSFSLQSPYAQTFQGMSLRHYSLKMSCFHLRHSAFVLATATAPLRMVALFSQVWEGYTSS